jgi:hypothetical protein
MSWYRITLSPDATDADRQALEEEFTDLFTSARSRVNAVLYSNLHGDGNCYYFSPRAAAIGRKIIARYSGTVCERPLSTDVDAVVGNDDESRALLRRDG